MPPFSESRAESPINTLGRHSLSIGQARRVDLEVTEIPVRSQRRRASRTYQGIDGAAVDLFDGQAEKDMVAPP